MSEELREKIARIINPGVWVEYDRRSRLRHYFEQELQSSLGGTFEEWRDVPPFCSLAKADSILALIDHLEADGMVLVPREPTDAMVRAGADNLFGSASEDWKDDARIIWSAMLSALPVLGEGR